MKITSPLIAGCFLFNSLQSGRCQEAGETYISDAAGNKYYLQDRNQFVSRPFVVASNWKKKKNSFHFFTSKLKSCIDTITTTNFNYLKAYPPRTHLAFYIHGYISQVLEYKTKAWYLKIRSVSYITGVYFNSQSFEFLVTCLPTYIIPTCIIYYILVRLLTSNIEIHNPCICNGHSWSCLLCIVYGVMYNSSQIHCIHNPWVYMYRGCVFLSQRLANVLLYLHMYKSYFRYVRK